MPWTILSVDDNKTIRFLVTAALKPAGCAICEAANGEEGLTVAEREKPNLILLDISMPVMDGVAMLTRLRANPVLQNIPVIMLTSWSGQERVAQVAELGVIDYLVKPFTKAQLLEKVGRVLNLQDPSTQPLPPRVEAPPTIPGFTGHPDAGQRYGLEPAPESVAELADLVSEQDVDLGEIAKVITRDPTLTARLLRAANPYHSKEEDYEVTSVEHALALNGIGCALILTMTDLLRRALLKTFHTMLGISLESAPPAAVIAAGDFYILSEVEFSGKAFGRIRLRLTQRSARAISLQLFGAPPKTPDSLPRIEEAICELTNMVAGNFLSNLADAGLQSKLTPPKVAQTADVRIQPTHGGLSERLTLKSPTIGVIVDIDVDPWRG